MRIVIIIALCLALAPAAHARDLTDAEKAVIANAMRTEKQIPLSAKYRWPTISGDRQWWYCAWVDYGSGFVPFEALLFWPPEGDLRDAGITFVGGREKSPDEVANLCKGRGLSL
jgi:hypothetical protein